MLMFRGVGWALSKYRDNAFQVTDDITTILQKGYKDLKINKIFGKMAGRFYIVFQINRARKISIFQEYKTKFCEHYT